MSPLDRKLIRDLSRLRGQVLTIALVVASGIAAFIAMRGNYHSLTAARDAFYARTRFADVFVHLERAPRSVAADLEAIPGVARVHTRISAGAMMPLENQSEPVRAQVMSVSPGRSPLNELELMQGRMVEPHHADEAVLLHSFAVANEIEVGTEVPAVINGVWRQLRVVGTALSPEYVMAIGAGDMTQDPARFGVVWMSEDALSAGFDMDGAFNDAALQLQPGASLDQVIDRADRMLAPYGGLGAIPRAKQLSNYVLDGELLQIQSMAKVVPAIFLAVAALLLNVVLSRLVHLQRPEIATLKAVGYSDREVGLHFFKLVAVIGLTGGMLGVGLGVWMGGGLVNLYGEYFKFPNLRFVLDFGAAGTAVGISLLAAGVGAFGAVRRVMVLPPAEAMRPAAPARYRQSIVDLLGLARVLGPSLQMIVRELERRPLRTLGSSVAIAASVGLMVVGGWYQDGLDALMYTQFHEVMREDVMVTFTEPRPQRAVRELMHLPGVLDAEGQRHLAVRFRAGHRSREASIIGYHERPKMRALRDKWGRIAPLPPEGVVLTEILGEILDVSIGDTITVELREGSRPTKELRVVGFVDEGFGLAGHMQASALHAFVGEEPMVTSGLLRVDPAEQAKLDRSLKRMPYVVAVTRRSDIFERFREQSGQMIATMTFLITLFAATITVGVVYNNARISLSMRARDLASLRVLGFRRREISTILLGEMAVQVLLALPMGLWFGGVLIHGIASTVDPETYRLPIIITARTHAYAATVAIAASALSALLVRRKLDKLDLIGVLKTRE